jgi:hypothetical protein
MDAEYGCNTSLRTGISALVLCHVAGILSQDLRVGAGYGTTAAEEVVGPRGADRSVVVCCISNKKTCPEN